MELIVVKTKAKNRFESLRHDTLTPVRFTEHIAQDSKVIVFIQRKAAITNHPIFPLECNSPAYSRTLKEAKAMAFNGASGLLLMGKRDIIEANYLGIRQHREECIHIL